MIIQKIIKILIVLFIVFILLVFFIKNDQKSKTIFYYSSTLSYEENNLSYWFNNYKMISSFLAPFIFKHKIILDKSTKDKILFIINNAQNTHAFLTTCGVNSCIISYDKYGNQNLILLFKCNYEQVLILKRDSVDRIHIENEIELKYLNEIIYNLETKN